MGNSGIVANEQAMSKLVWCGAWRYIAFCQNQGRCVNSM